MIIQKCVEKEKFEKYGKVKKQTKTMINTRFKTFNLFSVFESMIGLKNT